MKFKITIFIFFICISLHVFCQDTLVNVKCSEDINKKYVLSYFSDFKNVVVSPAKWEKVDYIKAGAIIATTFALTRVDGKIQKFAQDNRNSTTNNASKYFFEPFGSGYYSLPLVAGFYFYGKINNNCRFQQTALQSAKAFALASLTGFVLKNAFHRHRPYQNTPANPNIWDGPFKIGSYYSFPSGHTIAAFSVASVIATNFKDKPVIPIISYTIAAFTGLSRINDNKHWASDVFFGAVIGTYVGKLISKNNKNINIYSTLNSDKLICISYKLK